MRAQHLAGKSCHVHKTIDYQRKHLDAEGNEFDES